jgi:hypothetical protein
MTKQFSDQKQYDETNKGVLFCAADRKTKDNDRDYRGSININGTLFWVSGWNRKSKKGERFLALAVRPKDVEVAQPSAAHSDRVRPF